MKRWAGACLVSVLCSCNFDGAYQTYCRKTGQCVPGDGGTPQTDGSVAQGDGGTDGGSAFDQMCAAWARSLCARDVRCGFSAAAGIDDCAHIGWLDECADLANEVDRGLLTWDEPSGDACLAQTQAAESHCSNLSYPPCWPDDEVSANVSTSLPCVDNRDCLDPTEACTGTRCGRTCQPAGGVGQACLGQYGECLGGFWCDRSGSDTCKAPQDAGAACSGLINQCNPLTTYCNPNTSRCTVLPAANSPCAAGHTCNPSAYCDATVSPPLCRMRLATGRACSSAWWGCALGDYCDGSQTPPSCQPQLGPGGACPDSYACQDGLTCWSSSTCGPQAGIGGFCQYNEDCAQPNDGNAVECDQVTWTCVFENPAAPGGACDNVFYCPVPDETCVGTVVHPDGTPGQMGTCLTHTIGDPCTDDSQCPPEEYCAARTLHDGGASCRAAAVGTPCPDYTRCLSGQYCTSAGQCATQGTQGEDCDLAVDGDCTRPLVCKLNATDGGTCDTPGAVGAPCATDRECVVPFDCIGGRCASVGHAGEPCGSGVLCVAGACQRDAGRDGRGLCGPYRQAGEPCGIDLDCASDSCVQGLCQAACR